MLVFEEREKPEYPEKNLSEQGENRALKRMGGETSACLLCDA